MQSLIRMRQVTQDEVFSILSTSQAEIRDEFHRLHEPPEAPRWSDEAMVEALVAGGYDRRELARRRR